MVVCTILPSTIELDKLLQNPYTSYTSDYLDKHYPKHII